jgi:hypothetical protein
MSAVKNREKLPLGFETEIPPFRSLWIGVLQGTWEEMGIHYGQRAGKDIARSFDLWWRENVLADKMDWQRGRSEDDKTRYCTAYFQRSMAEFSHLCPELVEFFDAIGRGAAGELDRCAHAGVAPHLLKIGMLNTPMANLHPHWDFENDCPAFAKTGGTSARPTGHPDHAGYTGHDCNGFWVKGKATKTGESYATRSAQSVPIITGGSGRERQVAYVAIPKDPAARVFWGNGRAGNLGGLGGGLLNDRGVCGLTSGAQFEISNTMPDETLAPGIVDFWRASYGVIFSESAREAADRVTVGTERYRGSTGRKTVMKNRGCNIVFADANEAYVVEQNASRYCVRKPGDLGEKGADYIVHANHFTSEKGSLDNNNQFHGDEPMTRYCPAVEGKSSYFRFWSGMWMLHNHYGEIDLEVMKQELVPSHYGYDKTGKRYEPDPETGAPAAPGTWCTHEGERTKENPMGTFASIETSVFNLSKLEVMWVPVMPCHYKHWNVDWHYTNLTPFRDYRKLLWGY